MFKKIVVLGSAMLVCLSLGVNLAEARKQKKTPAVSSGEQTANAGTPKRRRGHRRHKKNTVNKQ